MLEDLLAFFERPNVPDQAICRAKIVESVLGYDFHIIDVILYVGVSILHLSSAARTDTSGSWFASVRRRTGQEARQRESSSGVSRFDPCSGLAVCTFLERFAMLFFFFFPS